MNTMSAKSILAGLMMVAFAAIALAQAPTVMTYQGRLLTNDGSDTPIDGTVAIDFAIYDSGGTSLWSESWPTVAVTDGVFSVLLGSNGTPLPAALFASTPNLFLELTIDGETATPRQQLGAAPFAMVDEPGNETQDLDLNGNTLSLTGDPSSVDLSGYLDNTDDQDLSLSGTSLTLTNDASPVDLSSFRDAKTGLGLRYCIATVGIFPPPSKTGAEELGTGSYLGEISLFPYTFCPVGTIECDGRLLPIAQNSALFSLLGTNFGGDGETTFGIPDLRNRVPLGQGGGVVVGGVY